VSLAAVDQIALDTVPPTIVSVSPAAGTTVAGLRPTFSVRFSEPIRSTTWLTDGLVLHDPHGTAIFGALTYDPSTTTGTFLPDTALAPGQPYEVQLGQVADVAGNLLPVTPPWTVVPLIPTQATLSASAGLVPRGASVTIDGQLLSVPGAAVTLERSVGDGPFEPFVPLLTADGGVFRTIATVTANTRFRVVYAGSDAIAGSTSAAVRVLVRRTVALAGVSATKTTTVSRGRTVSLKAVLTPSTPDVVVTFRIFRVDPTTGRRSLQLTLTRTTTNGIASTRWSPTRTGRYAVQLSTPPTAPYANGVSPSYTWVVR
jgi:hypothetical protein